MDLEATIRAIVRDEIARATPDASLVTVAAYAASRSISESTVRAAIREGRLAVIRYGRTGRAVRIKASDEIGKAERKASAAEPTATDLAMRKVKLRAVR
jgi:hypothetical protein